MERLVKYARVSEVLHDVLAAYPDISVDYAVNAILSLLHDEHITLSQVAMVTALLDREILGFFARTYHRYILTALQQEDMTEIARLCAPTDTWFVEIYSNPHLNPHLAGYLQDQFVREVGIELHRMTTGVSLSVAYGQVCMTCLDEEMLDCLAAQANIGHKAWVNDDMKGVVSVYMFDPHELVEILAADGVNPHTGRVFSQLPALRRRYMKEVGMLRYGK